MIDVKERNNLELTLTLTLNVAEANDVYDFSFSNHVNLALMSKINFSHLYN